MKKIIGVVLLITSLNVNAQQKGFNYGTRLAIGEATLTDVNLTDVESKLFIGGGVGASYGFNKYLGIMSDFTITSKGGSGKGFTEEQSTGGIFSGNPVKYVFDERVDLIDIEIPMMLRLGVGNDNFNVGVFAWPGLNFNVLGVSSRTYVNENYNEENGYQNQELEGRSIAKSSINYGLGVAIKANNGNMLYLDLRKSNGISDFGKVNDKQARAGYFAVSIAYTL